MKIKPILFLISFAFLNTLSLSAYAGEGKAYIPHWKGTFTGLGSNNSKLWISNITNHNIEVTIRIYDKNGNLIAPSSYEGFIAGNTQLAPKSSGKVTLALPDNFGFGEILWENVATTEDDSKALVAHLKNTVKSTSSNFGSASVSINAGLPF